MIATINSIHLDSGPLDFGTRFSRKRPLDDGILAWRSALMVQRFVKIFNGDGTNHQVDVTIRQPKNRDATVESVDICRYV